MKTKNAVLAILTAASQALLLAALPGLAHADRPAISSGPTAQAPAAASTSATSKPTVWSRLGICDPFDANCAKRLQKVMTAIHIGQVDVQSGVRFGEHGANGAVKFSAEVLGLSQQDADVHVIMFDAVYLPDAGGFRVRFTLANSDVMFFCKDEQGHTQAPLVPVFGGADCKPMGTFGIGGNIAQVQWDSDTHRTAVRWAELNAVFNLLRNGDGVDYLKRQLNVFAGHSLDTVWYGNTPGTPGGSHTAFRANLGITGMLRSDDNHWEIRGMAGYRPNVVSWDDFSVEARTQIMYHLFFSHDSNIMGTVGIEGDYQYNNIPANSIGPFASDRDKNSAYVGAMFGVVWQ